MTKCSPPPQPLSQKWPNWVSGSKKMRNVLKSVKETILQFLFFEKWSFLLSKFLGNLPKQINKNGNKKKCCPKRCTMTWNLWKNNFSVFISREMVDFVLKMLRKLGRKRFMTAKVEYQLQLTSERVH